MSSPGLDSFCHDGQQAPFDHGQRVNDASESGVSDNGAVFDMAESFVSEESGASCANDEECGNGFCGQSQTCVECRANRVQFETLTGALLGEIMLNQSGESIELPLVSAEGRRNRLRIVHSRECADVQIDILEAIDNLCFDFGVDACGLEPLVNCASAIYAKLNGGERFVVGQPIGCPARLGWALSPGCSDNYAGPSVTRHNVERHHFPQCDQAAFGEAWCVRGADESVSTCADCEENLYVCSLTPNGGTCLVGEDCESGHCDDSGLCFECATKRVEFTNRVGELVGAVTMNMPNETIEVALLSDEGRRNRIAATLDGSCQSVSFRIQERYANLCQNFSADACDLEPVNCQSPLFVSVDGDARQLLGSPMGCPTRHGWLQYHRDVTSCYPSYSGPPVSRFEVPLHDFPPCGGGLNGQLWCSSGRDGSPSRCLGCERNLYLCP